MNKKIYLIVLALALIMGILIFALAKQDADISPPPPNDSSTISDSSCVSAGCSSELCVDAKLADDIFTTCEYKTEYICYQNATCARLDTGECGFVEDEELLKCLERVETDFPNPIDM